MDSFRHSTRVETLGPGAHSDLKCVLCDSNPLLVLIFSLCPYRASAGITCIGNILKVGVSRNVTVLILTLTVDWGGCSTPRHDRLTPGITALVAILQGAEGAPGPVWKGMEKIKSWNTAQWTSYFVHKWVYARNFHVSHPIWMKIVCGKSALSDVELRWVSWKPAHRRPNIFAYMNEITCPTRVSYLQI